MNFLIAIISAAICFFGGMFYSEKYFKVWLAVAIVTVAASATFLALTTPTFVLSGILSYIFLMALISWLGYEER